MRVGKYQRPVPTGPCVPLAAARLFHLPLATSCPAQRGKADVQSGLPADAASLRETGSVDRYTLLVSLSLERRILGFEPADPTEDTGVRAS